MTICARWLLAAIGMGLLFLVVKGAEYAHHFGEGNQTQHQYLLHVLFVSDLLPFHARNPRDGHPRGRSGEGSCRRLFRFRSYGGALIITPAAGTANPGNLLVTC